MIYRLRNNETKKLATAEQLKTLRVNADGVVEMFCYSYTIPHKDMDFELVLCYIEGLKNSMCWQPAPEWSVEFFAIHQDAEIDVDYVIGKITKAIDDGFDCIRFDNIRKVDEVVK